MLIKGNVYIVGEEPGWVIDYDSIKLNSSAVEVEKDFNIEDHIIEGKSVSLNIKGNLNNNFGYIELSLDFEVSSLNVDGNYTGRGELLDENYDFETDAWGEYFSS